MSPRLKLPLIADFVATPSSNAYLFWCCLSHFGSPQRRNTFHCGTTSAPRNMPAALLQQSGRSNTAYFSRNYAASIATTLLSRIALMSRIGGWPKNRLYSRLNWLTLSYPTS